MAVSGHVLAFGKYKGCDLYEVPETYLKFLCCWNHYRDSNNKVVRESIEDPRASEEYLLRRQFPTVHAAREYVKNKRLCFECFRPLVPVGTARANGAWHDDWETRRFHKRCWASIGRNSSSSSESE